MSAASPLRLVPLGPVVHLHSDKGPCVTVCGQPCGTRATTAYSILDSERVTCFACLTPSTPSTSTTRS